MIKQATQKEAMSLAKLAIQMWEDNELEELAEHFEKLVADEDAACFLKYVDGEAVGFAQCQLRHDYVEGTETSPVGYLEGILVEEAYRHKGYAKELLRECEHWAKSKGCTEFASDCELENEESLRFHMAMQFEEANRVICFRKNI
ncbi:MAG: GNAT family N-acetyltransferase [Lachnospiraceae bacterium]|nr:GNAT family N-acetyltransferase [Lachnospiraceae bacterium]